MDLAYLPLLGKPLIFWLGIGSFAALLAATSVSTLLRKRIRTWLTWHKRFAWTAFLLAVVHGVLGILTYL